MKSFTFISQSEKETIDFGKKLAKAFKPGTIVCLFGDLGSGKTTLVKGFAQALKIRSSAVHSPTYVLMNIYEGKLPLFHFDLYRLGDTDDVIGIGYDEFLYGDGVAVVEWAERLGSLTPEDYLKVEIKHRKDGGRTIKLKALGKRYVNIMEEISN